MQILLEQGGLPLLVSSGLCQTEADDIADLLHQAIRLVDKRHATKDDLWRRDLGPIVRGDRDDHDEDAVRGERSPIAERHVVGVADVDAVHEDHPGGHLRSQAGAGFADRERPAVA